MDHLCCFCLVMPPTLEKLKGQLLSPCPPVLITPLCGVMHLLKGHSKML